MVNKIFRQGYYWLTLKKDVEEFAKDVTHVKGLEKKLTYPPYSKPTFLAPGHFLNGELTY